MGKPNSLYYIKKKYTDDIYNNTKDDLKTRLYYFKLCLNKVLNLFNNKNIIIKNINKIIIPEKIGCNVGGGNWNLYKKEIENFAQHLIPYNISVYIIIYNA